MLFIFLAAQTDKIFTTLRAAYAMLIRDSKRLLFSKLEEFLSDTLHLKKKELYFMFCSPVPSGKLTVQLLKYMLLITSILDLQVV